MFQGKDFVLFALHSLLTVWFEGKDVDLRSFLPEVGLKAGTKDDAPNPNRAAICKSNQRV